MPVGVESCQVQYQPSSPVASVAYDIGVSTCRCSAVRPRPGTGGTRGTRGTGGTRGLGGVEGLGGLGGQTQHPDEPYFVLDKRARARPARCRYSPRTGEGYCRSEAAEAAVRGGRGGRGGGPALPMLPPLSETSSLCSRPNFSSS